jgi:carbon monoxide dehydrogenase subunit G
MAVEVSIDIAAGRDEVWADVASIASHVEWMADAVRIDFATDQRDGVGTEAIVATKIGPFRTNDRMRFTTWDPPERMGVHHEGLFTGTGEFTLEVIDPSTTRFRWREHIQFPWYLGGPIGAWFAQPVLRWVWKRNLKRLRARFSAR